MVDVRSLIVGGLIVALSVGCATPRQTADKAFEAGEYDKALAHYRELIEEGTKDWEVYHRAAKAANHAGAFSSAERYYSQALRYGGGAEVARDFADFYLKTSNYTRAVRLLQFLLKTDVDKQPVYNNLGTALMYAGAALDAESYLLLAQQMAPRDPIPYVNLGVLYERHLNNPARAYGFYRCYLKFADNDEQRSVVRNRVRQLGRTYGSSRAARIDCGEPYQPKSVGTDELRAKFESAEGDVEKYNTEDRQPIDLKFGEGSAEETGGGEQKSVSVSSSDSADQSDSTGEPPGANKRGDGEGSSSKPEGDEQGDRAGPDAKFEGVEVIADEQQEPSEPTGDSEAEESQSSEPSSKSGESESSDSTGKREGGSNKSPLKVAREAWEEENYEAVVDEISALSVQEMSPEAMRLYGRALVELEKYEKARSWLESGVRDAPTPEAVGALLRMYDELGASSKIKETCREFSDRNDYRRILEKRCPDGVTPRDLDKKALEKYRKSK